ncbi:MAG: mannose-1-phosphate guanylyltransferase [Propionibacteriaceae bacterium]|nr:mannose-1-phosphate guanylyltransferase [Propionibacteriaceae bacterium]
MRYAVVMAGGSGTRLWPLSRQGAPKQLLELFDGKSLLRLAYERLRDVLPDTCILICTSRDYIDVVARQIPELPPENLLGEPVGRDSLNAVAWSAAVLAERDPEAVVAMLSADHVIEPVAEFQATLRRAFEVAEARPRGLVTMGVVPTEPNTGFGYLHRGEELDDLPGAFRVREFREKPDLDLARQYVASGQFWWNAGMFVWRAQLLLELLDVLRPDTAEAVRRIARQPELLDEVFPGLTKISVDYAVMQPASTGEVAAEVLAVPLEIHWADVGSHQSLAAQFALDEHGNRRDGVTVALDAQGCVLVNTAGEGHVVAALGMRDVLVVHTPSATLVSPLAEAARVKELVELVREQCGSEFA